MEGKAHQERKSQELRPWSVPQPPAAGGGLCGVPRSHIVSGQRQGL